MNTKNPPWVLKFISGKYQGGEFPLEEGKEIIVGRSSECDMVLVEDMVSRAHAALRVENNVAILRDNNSTNGSFVNGERVSEVELKEGDKILFGTSIIKLLRGNDASGDFLGKNLDEARESSDGTGQHTVRQKRPRSTTIAGMMSGMLEEVPLPDLLQLFSTSRKNGVLRIQGKREAKVYLRDGRAVFVEFTDAPGLNPEKVAYRLMGWTTGMFVLEPWEEEREFDQEIEMSTEGMMMEAMRLLDELENVRSDVPLDANLEIPSPLEPKLSELDAEHLDAFQLALNYGAVETILCGGDDEQVKILRRLGKLHKDGYVVVVEDED